MCCGKCDVPRKVAVTVIVVELPRRLRMISEALELYVEGGRVSHIWCMCVVGNGIGGLIGAGVEVVDGMHGGWSHVGGCRRTSRLICVTLMTPD